MRHQIHHTQRPIMFVMSCWRLLLRQTMHNRQGRCRGDTHGRERAWAGVGPRIARRLCVTCLVEKFQGKFREVVGRMFVEYRQKGASSPTLTAF